LQDLQDEGLGLNWGLTMDRITGLQDLKDEGLGLNWGLTMDRITGLQDLQDGLFKTKQGANNGQDCRIAGFTGWIV